MSRDAEYLTKRGWLQVSSKKNGRIKLIRWRKGSDEGPQGWVLAIQREKDAFAKIAQKAKTLMESP